MSLEIVLLFFPLDKLLTRDRIKKLFVGYWGLATESRRSFMFGNTVLYIFMNVAVALYCLHQTEACPAEPHLVVPHIALRTFRKVLLGVQLR